MKKYLSTIESDQDCIRYYESIVGAIPGGVVIIADNEDFSIIYANDIFYEMVGYDRQEYTECFGNKGIAVLYEGDVSEFMYKADKQLQETGKFCLKTRLNHKSKDYTWVNFSGKMGTTDEAGASIFAVVVDAGEQQDTLRQLQDEKTFNDLVADLSNEYFFDCDLGSKVMRYSKSLADRLGFDIEPSDYRDAFFEMGIFSHVDKGKTDDEILKMLAEGFEKELKLGRDNDEAMWYLCRISVLNDGEGIPVRIVGKLIDITKHKLQIDKLSLLAQRDQLTGLYNKAATESRIKEVLKMRRFHDDNCALMIIDVDNFKHINDRLGHLYGDAVLTQLAEHLKSLFRVEDVVGRIGGDEFFVFLKSYRTTAVLSKKAKEICALFHKTYSEGDTFVTISASIGIALCPEHGTDFDGLYKKADLALYDAKASGKNNVCFYVANSAQAYVSERTEIDGSMKKSFKDNRIEYVFRLLYDSENPVSSIQSVLQLVTESFGFSRGYIFETSNDGCLTSNTFEWCIKEITAEIHNLQNVPIEAVASANRAFLETGMFILKSVSSLPKVEREVLEPQGIKSMFQFGIMDRGKLIGFIGFDDCISEKIPKDPEIEEICTVCHVLATFLLKHRSVENELRHHEAIEMIMASIKRHIYVVDPEDFTVLYENQELITIMGGPSVGKKCYKAYGKIDKVCEGCPATFLNANKNSYVSQVKNEPADICIGIEAIRIDWLEGKTAFLLCGVDGWKDIKIGGASLLGGLKNE